MRVDGRAWHIAQRVSIRREVFSGDEDRVTYLQLVRENLAAASVCVLVEKRGQPDHVYLGALPDFSLAYYHTDHLGSSRLLSSTNGYPVWQGNFAAFGQEISPQSTVNHFKFTDLEHDSESNLEHTQFRQLSTTQGRWLTPDPYSGSMDLTNPQSLNRYTYVMNDPMDLTDPMGLDPPHPNCGTDTRCWSDWAKATYGHYYGGAQPFPPSPNWNDPFALLGIFNWSKSGEIGICATCVDAFFANFLESGNLFKSGVSDGTSTTGTCPAAQPKGSTTIISANVTTNAPTIWAGAAIGGLLGGHPGAFAGGIIGSFFGVGGTASYVPSTKSIYAGGTAVFGLGINGGSGFSANLVTVPSGQNPNSIANGPSWSVNFQPMTFLGSTVTKSPGSGPPVVGPSVGTRIPVSGGFSYNFPVKKPKGC